MVWSKTHLTLLPHKGKKCEVFHLFDSRPFYTIKPIWIGDSGTEIRISIFCFGIDLQVFLRKFLFADAESAQKIVLVS
jgi:hypothetical protein